MLRKLGIALAVLVGLVAVLAVVVALQPADFRIERSTTIAAPAPAVFAQVNDFRRWDAWSPWARVDPTMKQTFEGAPAGAGAVYRWMGNREVGEGRMTMTDSQPPELVRIRLEFMKPFAATNTAEFTFRPEGERTAVTWRMTGQRNFVAKAVCLVMDMDAMVGGMFEKGLAQMKTVAETAAKS
jgi:uncharacterized protein YndB with AHSA1/START domain